MAKGINKWIGIGNCCADPETRYTPGGAAITNVSIACNDSYKDKTTGERIDKPEFVRIVFFNRLAEVAGEYLRKGSQVYVEGKLQTRKWQDQSGADRYSTEIVASELQMLGSRDESAPHGQNRPQQANTPPRQQNAPHGSADAYRSGSGGSQQKAPPPAPPMGDFDDDQV